MVSTGVSEQADAVVVGGGLGGLATAALAAERGLRVVLLERSRHLGGRGRSRVERKGHLLNLGAHAFFAGGPGEAVLRSLGLRIAGRRPRGRALALTAAGERLLPTGPLSLVASAALGWRGKAALGALLLRLGRLDASALAGQTAGDWLDGALTDPGARGVLRALLRLVTYCEPPDALPAPLAVAHLQRAARRGVRYLDGGWQQLVDGLEREARARGVVVRTGASVRTVTRDGGGWSVEGVTGHLTAPALALAAAPGEARDLLRDTGLDPLAGRTPAPVLAACLDLALSALPRPRATYLLGLDRPVYASIHSRAARLAPPGGAVVHALRLLRDGEGTPPRRGRPGWRRRSTAWSPAGGPRWSWPGSPRA